MTHGERDHSSAAGQRKSSHKNENLIIDAQSQVKFLWPQNISGASEQNRVAA